MSNSLIEHLNPFHKLSIQDMSYSRLDTYQTCPAKFFYTYIMKAPRSSSPAAMMGTVVHEVLEIADFDTLSAEALIEDFHSVKSKLDTDNEIDNTLTTAAEDLLCEFADRHSGDEFHILHREMEFEIIIGSCRYRGFIDRVDGTKNGGVLITDYKAGKWEISQKAAPDNLQLGLYALAIHDKYPDLWPIKAELYYLRSGRRKGHTYSKHDLAKVRQRILELNKTVRDTAIDPGFPYTSNTRTCMYLCDFGKNGTCPRGRMVNS